ncbi:MAG: hypothetical protein MK215_01435 [Candidatus Poseidoniia archaeon]|jgi:hypothetical protein|nr:hypothetical protein [Candidatus Poseidoniia archaeon]
MTSGLNDGMKDRRIIVLAFSAILLGTSFGGCLGDRLLSDGDPVSISAPIWNKGHYWEYGIKTADIEISTTMIVAVDDDSDDYYIGTASLIDAKRHAVLNYNPALGRVQMSDFSIYENNIAQLIFDFPLEKNKEWSFSLYGKDGFAATVVDIQADRADIVATHSDGVRIEYNFDVDTKWINSFVFTESNGETILEMQLAKHGNDYTGNSYFCRGGDLYDEEFIGPDFGYYDTEFANEGHERYGPWNYVVYYLEAEIGSGSGELILRDHDSTNILVETFSPGNSKNELGTVMGTSGNWTLEISLSGDADVRIRIAGAIEYSYAV